MSTLTAEPVYHQWSIDGTDTGPKSRAEIQAFYDSLISSGCHQFEYDVERVVVGDRCVVTEGKLKIPFSGEMLIALGQEVESKAKDATSGRCVTFWPFDEDCKIIGEDIYNLGGMDITTVKKAEVYNYHYEGS